MPKRRTTVQFVMPEDGSEPDYSALARALSIAAEEMVEAENQLRARAIAALDAGDVALAREILVRWQTEPPTELADSIRKPAEPCHRCHTPTYASAYVNDVRTPTCPECAVLLSDASAT